MRRAEYIVARLLEANEGRTPPQRSIIAVIDDQPTYHVDMRSLQEYLAERGYGDFNRFLEAGGAAFIRDQTGSVRLMSQRLPLHVGPDTVKAIRQAYGFSETVSVPYQRAPGGVVTKRPLTEVFSQPLSQQVAAMTPTPRRKLTLGIAYPAGTENGVLVKEVEPGKAAAKAGLQPWDVIRATGHFTSIQGGMVGPFSIKTGPHLEAVLRQVAPQTVLPLRVIRKGAEVTVPVVPEYADSVPPGLTRPNEPEPVSKTGNQRASVAAIT